MYEPEACSAWTSASLSLQRIIPLSYGVLSVLCPSTDQEFAFSIPFVRRLSLADPAAQRPNAPSICIHEFALFAFSQISSNGSKEPVLTLPAWKFPCAPSRETFVFVNYLPSFLPLAFFRAIVEELFLACLQLTRRQSLSGLFWIMIPSNLVIDKSNFLFTDSADNPSDGGRDVPGKDDDLRVIRAG